MRRLLLLAVPLAIAAAAFGASRSSNSGSAGDAGNSVITFPLSLYVVHEADDANGTQDLAAFFDSDPNTNRPGLFTLELVP